MVNNDRLGHIGDQPRHDRSNIYPDEADPYDQYNGNDQVHYALDQRQVFILFKNTCCRLEVRQHDPFSFKIKIDQNTAND